MDNNDSLRRAGIQSLYLKVNGRNVHYLKAGSGPPVVLVHGGASDARDWLNTMAALADRFSFYAPDLIGFGQSERDEKGYYLSDFTDCLLGFMEALALPEPVMVGHSFGARVCLEMSRLHQEKISKLVLIDASGLGKISTLGNALFTFFWALRILLRRPQPFPRFLSKEGEDYNWVGREALQNLKVPTLLVWKSLDPYVPLSIARRAQKLIPGARLAVLRGYGHAPHQQKNSAWFNRVLREFLDEK